MPDDDINARLGEIQLLAIEIDKRLQQELIKLGFDTTKLELQTVDDAIFRLDKDPANGEYSLVGDWRDDKGMKLGMLLFHPDGSFYIEQDVILPHPRDRRWFVEAVTAWGRGTMIKSEARMLAALE